jgi:hypothetical protein
MTDDLCDETDPGVALCHRAAVLASNSRPGPRDDDGQPVIDPRSANVEIVCAHTDQRGSCGHHLGGLWRTVEGNVLVHQVIRPDARDLIRAYKGRRRGPAPSRPGDRYPDDQLALDRPLLLNDAQDVWVSCRKHGKWKLDLPAVRRRLELEGVKNRHQKLVLSRVNHCDLRDS